MARISCAIYALSQTIHSLKSTANTKDMILPRRIRDKERPVTFSKQRRNSNLRVCIASCEAHYEAGKVGQHCKIKGKSQPTWKLAKRLASPCGSRCYRLLRGLAPEVPPGADTKSRIYINNSARPCSFRNCLVTVALLIQPSYISKVREVGRAMGKRKSRTGWNAGTSDRA
jgi:hypothetical protein